MAALDEPLPGSAPERFAGEPMPLRARTARGTVVNAAFLVSTNGLMLIKGLAVASFLTTAQYGTWGLLMAAFLTILTLGSVGVDDKYVQQDEPDQERAFEIAFTFQVLLGIVFFLAVLVGMPLFALLYGHPGMIAPGMAFALAVPALVLQMPLWVHYRRMDFVRQRKLQAIDPVVSLVAVVALAAAGLGVWALVGGELLGTWCAAVAIVRASPYQLHLRWDRAALREYTRFSWPLLVGALSTVLIVQVPVAISSRLLGVAAVGGLALAANISQFTTRVDDVVTDTIYPAICAVKDRTDLLFESFWKSNRLALLWAAPLGAAAALFAGDFVHYVIGEKWRFAVPLIVTFGINAGLNQIGFNWTAFFRARGETKPIAVASVVALLATMALAVPLLAVDGLTGFGVGLCGATLISVALRIWYLRGLFTSLPVLGHVIRGVGPTAPGITVVLGLRALNPGPRSAAGVLAEALVFALLTIGVTYASQKELLRESVGYLRRGSGPVPLPSPDAAAEGAFVPGAGL
jgi:O-antigen/teichoic acid export membrane protein